jgi:mRNA interferase RelE/StbE
VSREVLLSSEAQREFERFNPAIRRQVRSGFLTFAETGRGDVKKLKGIGKEPDLFRLRVGNYRIVFAMNPREIRVTRIISRSEGYDWL